MNNIELYNDHFQNYKVYGIPKAQLVIADIPYNIGKDAYGSNPMWYNGGDIANRATSLRIRDQKRLLPRSSNESFSENSKGVILT